jgi:hypothetical protein
MKIEVQAQRLEQSVVSQIIFKLDMVRDYVVPSELVSPLILGPN